MPRTSDVPLYTVDLDLPARERWASVVRDFLPHLSNVSQVNRRREADIARLLCVAAADRRAAAGGGVSCLGGRVFLCGSDK